MTGYSPSASVLPVRVQAIRFETADTHSIELAALSGEALPPCAPGAHIDLLLPGELVRQYSLMEAGEALTCYRVAVKREPAGRGGSAYIHDSMRVGDEILISEPRNHFELAPDDPHVVLIAGGIGITPILSMAAHLAQRDRPWTLHYAFRSAKQAAFLDLVQSFPNARLYSDEARGGPAPIEEIVAGAPSGAGLYCCGPAPMLDRFEEVAAGRSDIRPHVERFTPAHEAATEGGFTVVLARTGGEVRIPPGKGILSVLLEAGLDLPHACEEGICGSCEVRVLEGVPDHRDSVLTASEQAANDAMMICCSGARTARLVLDI